MYGWLTLYGYHCVGSETKRKDPYFILSLHVIISSYEAGSFLVREISMKIIFSCRVCVYACPFHQVISVCEYLGYLIRYIRTPYRSIFCIECRIYIYIYSPYPDPTHNTSNVHIYFHQTQNGIQNPQTPKLSFQGN